MLHFVTDLFMRLKLSEDLSTTLAVVSILIAIGVIAVVVNFILKRYIVMIMRQLLSRSKSVFVKELLKHDLFKQLSHLGPALVIYFTVTCIESAKFEITTTISTVIHHAAQVYMLFAIVLFISVFMNVVNCTYKHYPFAKRHPIGGYLQVAKIILWALTAIFAISILINQSPWAFFTGLGAISAVLMLVFKDTILGFVASIQVSAYDMVRVGDWIQVDSLGANGDVVEVTINTVKVRNFDNTMVTIPTYSLISNGVINWRAMTESGGRRIKRSINIDMETIHFAGNKLLTRLKALKLLGTHISAKLDEIRQYNDENEVDESVPVNGRQLTNIGLFRAYIEHYLRHHPKLHQKMTLMVRQLEPTATGLPIQLYVFTNDVNWVHYENIQSDVFDHILSVLPLFELRVYQNISGRFIQ